MSSCKLDHSLEDVGNKLESQKTFLPSDLYSKCRDFLGTKPDQLELNELFHLLKKYDLSSKKEKENRNDEIIKLVN
ncbi:MULTISPECIES: hypothetical protein [unclassified Sutcliffiella]|jgi:hypothetical protein|uniref:hypothetical protein n=1 Tax=unclassified Sutcliffiella TaxID=2837532 RepID=UPI0030D5D637